MEDVVNVPQAIFVGFALCSMSIAVAGFVALLRQNYERSAYLYLSAWMLGGIAALFK